MAVATGTAALIAAGLSSAGTFGGAAMASRANNRATDAQSRATREALRYQREMELARAKTYQNRYEDWRRQYYGDAAAPTAAPAAGAPVVTPDAGGAAPVVAPPTAAVPAPVAPTPSLVGAPVAPTPAPETMMQPRTMADLAGWSQHSRYFPR